MDIQKVDSRTAFATKKHLAETLKKLMREQKFSKITVSSLVEAAGVNRKTFYYHFKNTSELLAWMFGQEVFLKLEGYNLSADYETALNFIMDYLEKNRVLIKSATDSIGWSEIRKFIYDDLHQVMLRLVKTAVPDEPEDYQEIAAEFYSEAMAGMLLRWIDDPVEYDRAELRGYFKRLFGQFLR